jgi:hypothetical protein
MLSKVGGEVVRELAVVTAVVVGGGAVRRLWCTQNMAAAASVAVVAAGIRAVGSAVLGIDAVVVEWAASGIENDVVTANTVSRACRKRTAAVGVVARDGVFLPAG